VQRFKSGVSVEVGDMVPSTDYTKLLGSVEGLREAIAPIGGDSAAEQAAAIEFLLDGLHLNKRLNKDRVGSKIQYRG
jgi:magnesium chelatase subunit I